MKLELKHLAGYLPYGLRVKVDYYSQHEGRIFNFSPTILLDFSRDEYIVKPILRPLSELTKEIEVNGKNVNIFDRIEIYKGSGVDYLIEQIRFGFVEVIIYNILLENHFDVFGLIEKGLAIDINTLNK